MKQHKSRRNFLKETGLLATAGTVMVSGMVPAVHAAENNTLKVALIGAGGRGRGAAIQALSADANVKLWSIADPFPGRSTLIARQLRDEFQHREQGHKVDVSPERAFAGLDGYTKALDSLDPGDVAVIAGPSGFRPLHVAYAVEKGLHIFGEKAVAVDVPGLKSLQETNRIAVQKGLKIAIGLNNRHHLRTAQTIRAIHDGQLGEIYSLVASRSHPPHGMTPRGDLTPLQHQLRRIFNFNWLTGSFIVDAIIHNLDLACWANQKLPVAAHGMGGRVTRREQDDLMDTVGVQYTFDDERVMHVQSVTMHNTHHDYQIIAHGEKGRAIFGEGISDPRFLEWNGGRVFWAADAPGNDSYQTQHNRLFAAIRNNTAFNEVEHGVEATMTGIMGRMACETGQRITREQAWTSTFQYAPNIAELTMESDSPFMPDENGDYPIAVPGRATINDPYA